MKPEKYFDWAATSVMSKEALDAYISTATEIIGNPSARNSAGAEAKSVLENSRKTIAAALKVKPEHIFFTSGATESNAIVLESLLKTPSKGEVILGAAEHSSIKEIESILSADGWKVKTLPVHGGYTEENSLKALLSPATRMVAVMLVNNVTGHINDIKSLVRTVREYSEKNGRKIHFHTDAVQAFGKVPFSITDLDVDSASFSSHKFCGPKGVGILYNRNASLSSLSRGGGQESGLRPGTENLPAIAAMAVAAESAMEKLDDHYENAERIRNFLIGDIGKNAPSIRIMSPPADMPHSPFILSLAAIQVPSEVLTRVLSDRGFSVSAGSACSNNAKVKGAGIPVLMGFPPEWAESAIRISTGYTTTIEDAALFSKALTDSYNLLKGNAK